MLVLYREMFGKCWENLIIVSTGNDFNAEDHQTLEDYQRELEFEIAEVEKVLNAKLVE